MESRTLSSVRQETRRTIETRHLTATSPAYLDSPLATSQASRLGPTLDLLLVSATGHDATVGLWQWVSKRLLMMW